MTGAVTGGAAPLVGRDRERALLRERLGAALAGRGRLVLIAGAAGIGKTILAEALLAEARSEGALVLVGRCYDLSETPPYGPWVEAVERLPAAQDRAGFAHQERKHGVERVRRRDFVIPIGGEGKDRQGGEVARNDAQQVEGGRVGPVQVLQEEEAGPGGGERR